MILKTQHIAPLLALSFIMPVFAQTPSAASSDTTPRQHFVAFISGTPVKDLKFKPLGSSLDEPVLGYTLPEKPAAPEPEEPEEPEEIADPIIEIAEKPAAGKEVSEVALIESEIVQPKLPIPVKATPPKTLPFYVSAPEYLAARATNNQQIALTYTVSAANAKSGLTVPPRTQKILIGPDYAASVRDNETRIYDFRTARVLTIVENEDSSQFENSSLYAAAYKNVDTVNKATRAGALKSIKIGPDLSLDSFWLEASLGWTARSDFENLSASRKDAKVEAAYDGKTIVTMELSGPELPSEAHMRSLFAFWHHDTAIHPAILPKVGRPEHAPKSLTITSFSPSVPDGMITTWALTEARTEKSDFPLSRSAKNILQKEAVSPLAFVIAAAAKGEAVPDRLTPIQLREDMHNQREAGKNFEAWLSGKILADRLGGCDNDPALLCQDIKDLESGADDGSDLDTLSKATAMAQKTATRVKAFEMLIPFIDGEIAPAFLVKMAGQVRSRIKSKDVTPKIRAYRADRLLEEALAKNPYDPEIYKSLAQVYAAQGRFAESWDIYDAMRGLPNVPKALTTPINRAEASIKTRAPGFFAPLTP